MNMNTNIREEDIVLAPQTEIFDEAKKIADTTANEKKYSYIIKYDANQKEFFLAVVTDVGAIIEEERAEESTVVLLVNPEQLDFLKTVNCIDRVQANTLRQRLKAAGITLAEEEKRYLGWEEPVATVVTMEL